jgi:hypothetical protein
LPGEPFRCSFDGAPEGISVHVLQDAMADIQKRISKAILLRIRGLIHVAMVHERGYDVMHRARRVFQSVTHFGKAETGGAIAEEFDDPDRLLNGLDLHPERTEFLNIKLVFLL